MESTVYALLAGFQNFGGSVARSVGVGLIDYLGIKTKAPCNFDNLTKVIVIAHVVLPVVTIPLVFLLIPDAKMTDSLVDEADGKELDGDEEDGEDANGEMIELKTYGENDEEEVGDGASAGKISDGDDQKTGSDEQQADSEEKRSLLN